MQLLENAIHEWAERPVGYLTDAAVEIAKDFGTAAACFGGTYIAVKGGADGNPHAVFGGLALNIIGISLSVLKNEYNSLQRDYLMMLTGGLIAAGNPLYSAGALVTGALGIDTVVSAEKDKLSIAEYAIQAFVEK